MSAKDFSTLFHIITGWYLTFLMHKSGNRDITQMEISQPQLTVPGISSTTRVAKTATLHVSMDETARSSV